METIGIIATAGILNIVCFFIGHKAGKGEEIKLPDASKLNPTNAYHTRKEKKAAAEEAERVGKIIGNIERYDGTDAGQQDIG